MAALRAGLPVTRNDYYENENLTNQQHKTLRCYLPFLRYSRLNGPNLPPGSIRSFGGTAAKRGDFLSRTDVQNFTPIGVTVVDISVTAQKYKADLISDKTYTSVAFVDSKRLYLSCARWHSAWQNIGL